MKKVLAVIIVFSLFACQKEKKVVLTGNETPLNFISLVAADSVLHVNVPATFIATATGDGLTYTWSCDWGTFIGSGAQIQWVACHQSTIPITCIVEDMYNRSQSKTIEVKVK